MRMYKKPMTFRLSEETRSILERISHERGLTATAVVELALRDYDVATPSEDPPRSPEPIDTPAAKRKTKPASTVPKLVGGETVKQRLARVDTRDAQERGAKPNVFRQAIQKPDWAVKPAEQRKINPMTGKPFGAVPK